MCRLAFLMLLLLSLTACRGPAPSLTPESIATKPSRTTATIAAQNHTPVPPTKRARFAEHRKQMVIQTLEGRDIADPDVLHAMQTVLRHEFVPDEYVDLAYADRPLPIGYGQTISQPYVVAWMTQLLELEPGAKVLEIGTGSGYQAAVLAELPEVRVYTIEIVPQLAEQALQRLKHLGYAEIQTRQGDGYYGWPEHAPFDAIIVTAAPDHLPQPLVEQLADGGRLVVPIGAPGSYQSLWQFVKTGDELEARNLGGVAFVPFTGAGIEGAEP